ncbi:MAG: DUF3344 domain-containing protein [Methanomicrobia archaeon]|nr:DUF3344 domain-containing protein [Methanomicrobia archaeon]
MKNGSISRALMKGSVVCMALSAVILTLSTPANADYTADHPLTTYAHDTIYGDLIYTIGDSDYMGELSPGDIYTVSFDLDIPDGATVKIARLYAYWTWSHAGEEGVYPDMDVTFDGAEAKLDREYPDRKGSGDYDYPSGTYCYDVTDQVWGSSVYITTAENSATESKTFSMVALALLVIYEDASGKKREYWLNEGCDILNMKIIEHAEDAITTARFGGVIESEELQSANLVTIVPSGDRGENTLLFNAGIWDSVYTGDPYDDLAIDTRDVTEYVVAKDNIAKIEDDGDYLVPSGAFLVVTYKEEEDEPSPVVTPIPTASPTPAASATATPSPIVATPAPTFSPTPSPPTPTPSGFEVGFTVAGFLILTLYHMRRKNES